jgi:hypothetical protein
VYKFPKKPEEVITSMTITIGNKTIEGKIMEKYKAKEKYDDAIASGKAAVKLSESKFDFLELDIGNILPG